MPELEFIVPDWPAPPGVRAASSTRVGGVSARPFESLNLGAATDDDPAAVAENRVRLRWALGLTREPAWLAQVHGNQVVRAFPDNWKPPRADAAWTAMPGVACTILAADCLPVLLCDRAGSCVAAAHAGWRGLACGVIRATIAEMPAEPSDLMAWLGPAIGPERFEIGAEVGDELLAGGAPESAFRGSRRAEHYLCDLYAVAREQLRVAGVTDVYGGGFCTHSDPDRFFSYRRDGETGRMATLVWLD